VEYHIKRHLNRFLIYLILIVGAVLAFFPFYWMVIGSFKQEWDLFRWPPSFILTPSAATLKNYVTVFQRVPVGRMYFNSAFVALGRITLNLFISLLTAYALAKLRFPGKSILFSLVLLFMMLPFQLLLVPLFLLMDQYGWLDTYQALILPVAVTPFSIFLLRQAFMSIPDDYIEAAKIDGANQFYILFRVVAPMVRPIIWTVVIITFYWAWNDFIWPNVAVVHNEMAPVPVGLFRFFANQQSSPRWGPIVAFATLVPIPVIVLFTIAQRQFIEAMVNVGLK
jgi:ABC-type glycerol-3-phosphate transport system permease component